MPLDLSVLLVLVLNSMAWVWGAGRLMQSVKSLEKTSEDLERAVKDLTGMLASHATRLAVLESKIE